MLMSLNVQKLDELDNGQGKKRHCTDAMIFFYPFRSRLFKCSSAWKDLIDTKYVFKNKKHRNTVSSSVNTPIAYLLLSHLKSHDRKVYLLV